MSKQDLQKQETLDEFMSSFTEREEQACELAMEEARERGDTVGQQMAACAAVVRGMRGSGEEVERSLSEVEKRTIRDKETAIQEALNQAYRDDDNRYVYPIDFDDDYVYFELGGILYRQAYEVEEVQATLLGERQEVNRETFYVVPGEEVERGALQKQERSDYAYTPTDNPSDWKLNISTARNVAAAVAALGPGFRGNRVQIPEEDRAAVVRRVRAAYRRFFPDRVEEDGLPEVLRSLSFKDKLIGFIDKHFGDGTELSEEFDMKPEDAMVIKQFEDEEMIEYAPLYKAANEPDLVGDAMSQATIDNMVSQLNKAIKDGVQLENLGHKVPIKNAWEYQEVFTSPWPSCMVGDIEVTKGQPVLVIKYHNQRAWELRKQGVIKGPSISGRGRFVENIDD